MKRINISITDQMAESLRDSSLNISLICRIAITQALLKEWAEKEERKRLAMLE